MHCFVALVFLSMPFATGQPPSVDNYSPRTVLPLPMRALTNPKIRNAAEAKIADNELVIGVEVGGEARAYPINQLTGPSREIINDQLAGIAIAATW
jgi:hypothetical protein